MSESYYDFVQEFPEYKARVHELKMSDQHFAKLFLAYQECNDSLHRMVQEIETPSDAVIEEFKKHRLHLKDEMLAMIKRVA